MLSIAEGDAVRLRVNGTNVFYGFVFNLSRDNDFSEIIIHNIHIGLILQG